MDAPQKTTTNAGAGRAIFLLAIAAFASAATTRICDALLPQLASEFAVTPGRAAAVVTAYSVTYGLMQPPVGVYGDRLGKYRMILICCVLSMATTLACALVTTLDGLAVARLAAGAAAAGIVPLALAWIGDNVDYSIRQTTIARFMMGQVSGLIAGQAFGGWFGELYGWRSTFLVILALYLVATLGLGTELLRNPQVGARAISATPVRFTTFFASSMRNPRVRRLLLATFLEGFLCFGAVAYISTMLHLRFGLTFGQAGLLLATFGLGGLTYALSARVVVPKLGESGVSRLAGGLFFASFVGLAVTPSPLVSAPLCLIGGAAYYLMHSVLQVNATQLTPEARGAGMSMFATSFFLGQGVGVAAAGPVVDRFGATPVFLFAALALPALAFWIAARVATRV